MKQPDENNASSSSSSSNKPENNDIVSDSQYLKTMLPSGYKFNPLDQELILDYLVPKLKGHKLPRNLMHEVDFYKYDPDYLSAKYEAQGPRTWYFFTSMVKLGSPQNRNTENGYWKITGKKETINYDNDEVIGLRRNLEFYIREKRGGVKTKWLMHEFVVEGQDQNNKREKNLDKVLCKLYTNDRRSSNSKGQEEAKKLPDKEQESNLESDGNNNDSDTPPTKRPHHHHNNNQHVSYKECLKNHAASIGGHALDGCREFMVGPNANPLDPTSLTCAACGCHRNFHRRDPDDPIPLTSAGGGGGQNGNFQSKKSYRTKFSQEQKEKMYALSEKIGWKLKKSEESLVEDFCKQVGVDTTVFRFWMQNNKHSSTTSASAATPSTPRMRITTGIGILGNNNNTTNSANNSNSNSISK